ncbi:poly(U)-specific 3'-to-5' RNA exonuclease [Ceratobasidium sp. 428]|nr:poly(U)-specific 3'-to-5' RNA exonuclease [Ceratobasidium sp. 428]
MLSALVNYSDESETEEETGDDLKERHEPLVKLAKRKNSWSSHRIAEPKKAKTLPKLESTLFTPAPVDDPSKHQGRTRSVPYVEGQFVGHVYLPIKLEEELLQMLREVVRCAQATNPAWYSLLDPETEASSSQPSSSKVTMHLSLSRPIPLRAHQRDDLRKEVRRTATQSRQQFTALTNDEKTRTFLCAEVGAGHKQLQELSQSLSSHVASLRQLPYYSQPRFHISIAWILAPSKAAAAPTDTSEPSSAVEVNHVDQFLEAATSDVQQLQQTFSKRLLDLGRLDIRSLEVKIGKEVHKWPLAAPS